MNRPYPGQQTKGIRRKTNWLENCREARGVTKIISRFLENWHCGGRSPVDRREAAELHGLQLQTRHGVLARRGIAKAAASVGEGAQRSADSGLLRS
jgi:hypothetical protein